MFPANLPFDFFISFREKTTSTEFYTVLLREIEGFAQ